MTVFAPEDSTLCELAPSLATNTDVCMSMENHVHMSFADFETLKCHARGGGRVLTMMSSSSVEVVGAVVGDSVLLRGPDGTVLVVQQRKQVVDLELQLVVHPIQALFRPSDRLCGKFMT